MEAMRDVALTHYEALPDEEQVKIIDDFKKFKNGDLLKYVHSRSSAVLEIVQDFLKIREEHKEEEGSDFKAFITLNYVLGNPIVRCDGCSSLLLGKTYFSCEECFFNYSNESYDLCCDCYRSRKFENHNHKKFCNNQTLQYLSRRKFAEVKRDCDSRQVFLEGFFLNAASSFLEIAGDLKTKGWKAGVEGIEFDQKKNLAEISNGVNKIERTFDATEEEETENATRLTSKSHRSFDDLSGVEPSQKNDEDEEKITRFTISDLTGATPSSWSWDLKFV